MSVSLLTNCIYPAFQEGFTLKRQDATEVDGGSTNALVTPTKERYLYRYIYQPVLNTHVKFALMQRLYYACQFS